MSDPKRELADVITARYSSFDGLSALGIAAAIVEAGWVDPETHAGLWRAQRARAEKAEAKATDYEERYEIAHANFMASQREVDRLREAIADPDPT